MCFAFLSNLYGEFMQALGASIRIFELMDRESEVKDGDQTPEQFDRGISFEDVSFSYPSRPDEPVLKGISFEVKPGQVVALVGPSGGGKSTCVRLIEHFYEISDGSICLGERDVRTLDPSWFRRRIGLVSQEPVLFACSIRDNISYGKDSATQEEVEAAAKQANAHEFITSFENGYDTMVGERGIRLSGGQKQRVAIARALLLDPDLLLLDEATSALDAESEHLVQEAIDRAMQGRTVLVIAHRLSTVRDASQVIVIEKGCVVEQGTHSDLLAQNGVYKQLVMRQLMKGDEA
jgi:ABC-type multidrug transport system fused ATPase/permease subunit